MGPERGEDVGWRRILLLKVRRSEGSSGPRPVLGAGVVLLLKGRQSEGAMMAGGVDQIW